MNLIKLIVLIILIFVSFNTNLLKANSYEIVFSINDIHYTDIDIRNWKKYLKTKGNEIEINDKEVVKDFISIKFFEIYYDKNFNNIKYLENETEKFYTKNFTKWEENKKNNNDYLDKDQINKYITLDIKRKIVIEDFLNEKKDKIFSDKEIELYDIYQYEIKFLTVDNIEKNNNFLKNKNIEELKKIFKSKNIEFIVQKKIINEINDLDDEIKYAIYNEKDNFIIEYGDKILKGEIKKNLLLEDKVYYSLKQIITTVKIDKKYLNCKKIDTLKKIEIIKRNEIELINLNEKIKTNLKNIDDYILFNIDNKINYLILCNITFDKNHYKQLKINNNINLLINKIEEDFIKDKRDKYNLIINNE